MKARIQVENRENCKVKCLTVWPQHYTSLDFGIQMFSESWNRNIVVLRQRIYQLTMSAKSLGTLAMIYATDELQNPLPLKTMLCEGDMNNPVRRSDAFLYN